MRPALPLAVGLLALGAVLVLERVPSGLSSAPERRAAAGAGIGSAEAVDDEAFPPLPKPGPLDWLSAHPEEGQTFEAFRTAPRRIPSEERRTIRLRPLDDVARMGVGVDLLAEHLSIYYGLPAVAGRQGAPADVTTRMGPGTDRRQLLTPDVLAWLELEMPSDAFCMLAVTAEDLYPDASWNYVFGEASLRSGVGVFSFARMDPAFPRAPTDPSARGAPDRALVLRRCLKVVTHEVGHMFGMEHCIARLCLMNGSNHVGEMDRAPLHLCPDCLAKARHAAEFDPEARYAALAAYYERVGLEAEARWARARRTLRGQRGGLGPPRGGGGSGGADTSTRSASQMSYGPNCDDRTCLTTRFSPSR